MSVSYFDNRMPDATTLDFKQKTIEVSKLVVKHDGSIVNFNDIMTTTRTVIAITNLTINIENFFKYMPITNYTPIVAKRGRKPRVVVRQNVEKLPVGSIVTLKYGKLLRGVELKKKKSKKSNNSNEKVNEKDNGKKSEDYFRHSVSCVIMAENNKPLNIKVPSNGKLQMTGCKTDEHSMLAVSQLVKIMTEVEKWTGEKLYEVDGEKVQAIFNIVMQNKDFQLGFKINRQNLDTFINKKTNFHAIFEASTATGINIKLVYENNNKRHLLKMEYDIKKDEQKLFDICYDEYFKVLNDKDKEAELETKYVTFFVFSSGHIIMSSRPYNMEKYFYDVVKILIKNQSEFEEKADVRKVTKSKKTKRSKIEIEDD
jgi:hypothetical protein